MPDRRCLTCHFWVPAYPEDDLHAAERAMEGRRGFGAALAGACVAPGRGRHATSRHCCDRWARPADPHPNPPVPVYRAGQGLAVGSGSCPATQLRPLGKWREPNRDAAAHRCSARGAVGVFRRTRAVFGMVTRA